MVSYWFHRWLRSRVPMMRFVSVDAGIGASGRRQAEVSATHRLDCTTLRREGLSRRGLVSALIFIFGFLSRKSNGRSETKREVMDLLALNISRTWRTSRRKGPDSHWGKYCSAASSLTGTRCKSGVQAHPMSSSIPQAPKGFLVRRVNVLAVQDRSIQRFHYSFFHSRNRT